MRPCGDCNRPVGDVRADRLTRILFATDASIYQIEAGGSGISALGTGSKRGHFRGIDAGTVDHATWRGTSLLGNAIGDGLIVDFSTIIAAFLISIWKNEACASAPAWCWIQLNNFLKPHGFCFGPDVATSSRATIGGMIANNSSGARAPFYGTTADHVLATEIVLTDGRIAKIGSQGSPLEGERAQIERLLHLAERGNG